MNRRDLNLALQAIAERVNVMRPYEVDYLTKQLQKVTWLRHVTDDVYRCCLCSAQDTHTDRCPAALLEAPQEARTL